MKDKKQIQILMVLHIDLDLGVTRRKKALTEPTLLSTLRRKRRWRPDVAGQVLTGPRNAMPRHERDAAIFGGLSEADVQHTTVVVGRGGGGIVYKGVRGWPARWPWR